MNITLKLNYIFGIVFILPTGTNLKKQNMCLLAINENKYGLPQGFGKPFKADNPKHNVSIMFYIAGFGCCLSQQIK